MELSKIIETSKPTLRLLEKAFLPLMGIIIVIDFWDTINKGILILLFLYLLLGVLEKLDITFKPLQKLKETKVGKIFLRGIRSTNPITQMTEEHIEETTEIIADQIKVVVNKTKKMKEEFKMKKRLKALKLMMKHNKSVITGYVLILLYLLEICFKWATNWGIPKETLPYIAVFIVGFIFYVMFGEGFTFNNINILKEAANKAKIEANKQFKSTKKLAGRQIKAANVELKAILKEINRIDLLGVPVEYQQEYNILNIRKDKWLAVIEELEEELK